MDPWNGQYCISSLFITSEFFSQSCIFGPEPWFIAKATAKERPLVFCILCRDLGEIHRKKVIIVGNPPKNGPEIWFRVYNLPMIVILIVQPRVCMYWWNEFLYQLRLVEKTISRNFYIQGNGTSIQFWARFWRKNTPRIEITASSV